MKKYLINREAFTLIEVLLSLVILSIVFLVISNFFFQSLTITERNNEHFVAINLARTTVDKVKSGQYPIQVPGSYVFGPCLNGEPNCTPVINHYRFTTTIVVQQPNTQLGLTPFTVLIEGEKTSTSLDGYIQTDTGE